MDQKVQFSLAQVLITGGSEGIGFALAERFLQAGAKVPLAKYQA